MPEVQVPQPALRAAPQLSVPATVSQLLPRRAQNCASVSATQPPPAPPVDARPPAPPVPPSAPAAPAVPPMAPAAPTVPPMAPAEPTVPPAAPVTPPVPPVRPAAPLLPAPPSCPTTVAEPQPTSNRRRLISRIRMAGRHCSSSASFAPRYLARRYHLTRSTAG